MLSRAPTADGPLRRAARVAFLLVASGAFVALAPPGPAVADVVRILSDDREAAQARADLIETAHLEINVASFAVADDEIGRSFLALLRDAARRGVTVRLLVDGLNNHIPDSIQRHLIACGVQLRAYHPVTCTRPLWLNRRLHDKLVIVDCDHLIVGSRNLDNRNFGLACRNFVDADAYVRGCAAHQAHRYFMCVWNSDQVRPLQPDAVDVGDICPCLDNDPACPRCALGRALESLIARGFLQLGGASDWSAGQPDAAEVYFLSDDCGRKTHDPASIHLQLLKLLARARQSIILESPYLVFSQEMKNVVIAARARGVEVVILTNSLASTDQLLVYAGYANQRQEMLDHGVEFWEYAGPNHFHAKTVLVDGYISVIGSYNFDPRSDHLNTETAIITNDLTVADGLIERMAEHFSNAWQIGPDGKPLGMNTKHPGADALRVHRLRAARAVAPLIKRHL